MTAQRVAVLKDLLEFVGIDRERLNLVWVSSAEGPRFAEEITEFTIKISALGPLDWRPERAVPNSELRVAEVAS
jgi:F420-non-reducing hydrogenase iron-sulfur subunit